MKYLILLLFLPTLLFSQQGYKWRYSEISSGIDKGTRVATVSKYITTIPGKNIYEPEERIIFELSLKSLKTKNQNIIFNPGLQFDIVSDYFKIGTKYRIHFKSIGNSFLSEFEFFKDGSITMIGFTNEKGEKLDIYDILYEIRKRKFCLISIVGGYSELKLFMQLNLPNSADAIDFVQGL